jgi:hypothetical protein
MHLLALIVNNDIEENIASRAWSGPKQVFWRVSSTNFHDKLIQYWASGLAGFFNNGYIVCPLLSNHAGSGLIMRVQIRETG